MKLPVTRTKVQVRYSDTDALGHISSGSYITFMQVGRLDFFKEITQQTGYVKPLVVANINIDYFHECRYGDDIEVVTWCARVGNKSLNICSEIFANGELVAKGSSAHVGFNSETRKSEQLPKEWESSDYS
jgi:acyl-CoA thioester hydrolase